MGEQNGRNPDLRVEFSENTGSVVNAIPASFAAPKVAVGEAFVIDMGRIEPSAEEKNKRFGMEQSAFDALPERVKDLVLGDYEEEEFKKLEEDQFILFEVVKLFRVKTEQLKRFQDAYDRTVATYQGYLFDAQKAPLEVRDIAVESLDAELRAVKDHTFLEGMKKLISQGWSAEVAIDQFYESQIKIFQGMEDPYFKKTAIELKQHRAVMQHHLHPDKTPASFADIWGGAIIVASEVPLAAILFFEDKDGNRLVKGVITKEGAGSHAEILLQAMGIPYAQVSEAELKRIKNGEPLAMDGQAKQILLYPSKEVLSRFDQRVQEQEDAQEFLRAKHAKKKSVTTQDGEKVNIHANFAISNEAHGLKRVKPAGIGLYRTEIAATMRGQNNKPKVEGWKTIFKANMASCSDKDGDYIGTTFRTVDFDGDKSEFLKDSQGNKLSEKEIEALQAEMTANQFEALALLQDELVKEGKKNKIKVMVPMIESVEHMQRMQKIMDERAEKAGVKSIKLGCMYEVPALGLQFDTLDTDFISIGTNDLIANLLYPKVGRYGLEAKEKCDPTSPSVLKALRAAVIAGEKRGIPVSICGNMASDPKYMALLLGVGLRNMSCGVDSIPKIKEMASRIDTKQAEDLVDRMIHEPIRAKREEMLTAFNEALGLSPDGTIDLDWAPPQEPTDELDINPNSLS